MTQASVHDSTYSWLRLLITMMIGTVANVSMWAVVVVMPGIETEFGASRADASLPYTLTMVGFAVGNLLIGRVVDRFGVTVALIGAAIGIAIGYGLAMISPSMLTLSLAHLVLGLGAAVGFGPLIADISHWFLKRRGIAVALAASANYLSGAIWPTLLAGMLAESGWRSVYATLAIVTLVVLLPLSLLLRRRLPAAAHNAAEAASALRAHSAGFSPRALQYILGFAGIACCVAMAMPQVHIVAYCVGLGYGPGGGRRNAVAHATGRGGQQGHLRPRHRPHRWGADPSDRLGPANCRAVFLSAL